jgi:hypothetical protein
MPIIGSLATASAKGYGFFSAAGPVGGNSARAITGMGDNGSSLVNTMEYFDITTTGNASSFGNLSQSARHGWATASTTRALLGGGVTSPNNNSSVMDYVTIATTGNSTNFGTSSVSRPRCMAGGGNTTRGVIAGAGFADGSQSVNIEYHTFATTGNGTSFGDMTTRRQYGAGGSSPTRTVFGSGYQTFPSTNVLSSIDYITTASTGNGTNFGSLTVALESRGAAANSTRCLFSGGYPVSGSQVAVVEYITIASTGNGTDYGDLSVTRSSSMATANNVRAVFIGGYTSSDTYSNVIDFIVIADGGNATDFGDLGTARSGNVSTSAGHGGLQ